jgi:hypothetical protein
MNISGVETKYQNYAPSSNLSLESNSSVSTVDWFQNELLNLENRFQEAKEKQQKNDNSGNIMMSEKQWRSLMKKVDNAIDAYKENLKQQEQEEKKQLEEKPWISKDKDTVTVSI